MRSVPRPAAVTLGGMPFTRTQHTLLTLMNDERALPHHAWMKHATELIAYLEERKALNPEECPPRSRGGSRP